MSDMKCPICNDGKIITYLDGTYECDNAECSIYNGTHTETFEALIRTRKALDVAVDELNKIKVAAESVGIGFFMSAAIFALAKIKQALERKDE